MLRNTFFLFVISIGEGTSPTALADEKWSPFQVDQDQFVDLMTHTVEAYEWFETRDGYSVVRTPTRYEYAFPTDEGGIEASGIVCSNTRKLPFAYSVRPTIDFLRRQRQMRPAGGASPPGPGEIALTQPDGKSVKVFLKGSAAFSWYEDKHGYSILPVVGQLEYAIRSPDGSLVGCGLKVGVMSPDETGLRKHIRPGAAFLQKQKREKAKDE